MNNIKVVMSLIKRDIITSKKSIVIKFGIFFMAFTVCTLFIIHNSWGNEIINTKSLILRIFKGCDYVEVSKGALLGHFEFPVVWLFINSFIIYAVGDYFYNDIKTNGKYVLIRVKKMKLIYIAKIVWSILIVILYYSFLLLICGALGKLCYNDVYKYMDPNYFKIGTLELIKNVLVMYSLTTISLVVIFITITLKLKPVHSFLIDVALCVTSVFVESKLFIGQHNLLIRHVPFDLVHNLTMYDSIIYNLIVTICVIIIGSVVASKKEVF